MARCSLRQVHVARSRRRLLCSTGDPDVSNKHTFGGGDVCQVQVGLTFHLAVIQSPPTMNAPCMHVHMQKKHSLIHCNGKQGTQTTEPHPPSLSSVHDAGPSCVNVPGHLRPLISFAALHCRTLTRQARAHTGITKVSKHAYTQTHTRTRTTHNNAL